LLEVRYIPPFSDYDRPSPELVILFLEAVARVTPAFRELRDSVLPLSPQRDTPSDKGYDEMVEWIRRWHLLFENSELNEMIEPWICRVLHWWSQDPVARETLRVDCQWWERSTKLGTDKKPVQTELSQWNPDRENFEKYARRMRSNLETFLQEQKRIAEQDLERFGQRPYRKRDRDRPAAWDFEWLALSICRKLSDGEIAQRQEYKGVRRESVKKARQALQQKLKISRSGK